MATDFNSVISQASSERGKEEKAEALVQLVVFELDREEYAVPIEDLREIIRIPEIAPVPNAPNFIRGILNLRGTIVVVVDLEKRFHLTREQKAVASHIIIAEVDKNTYGIVVDKVSEVLRVPVSKIQPAPSLVSSKIHADYLKGVAVLEQAGEGELAQDEKSQQSRLVILLDLPKLLSEDELLRLGSLVEESARKAESNVTQ
jgi:purine-binding chemotaxis protein CheW